MQTVKALPVNGINTIEGGTLSVYYHLESTKFRHKVVLRVSAPRENPEVESVSLFGIQLTGMKEKLLISLELNFLTILISEEF